MSDKEYCEADNHDSTNGDKPEGSFATGSGKLYATVVDNGGAVYLIAGLVGADSGAANLDLNGEGELVIACGSLGLLEVVGAVLKTENYDLTVIGGDHIVSSVGAVCIGIGVCSKPSVESIACVCLSGGDSLVTADNSIDIVEDVNAINAGGDNVNGNGAVSVSVELEDRACKT